MDSQYSNSTLLYDGNFLKLLDIKAGWFKKRKFKKCSQYTKEFYKAYIKKCNEYDVYMDFFSPLYWHLICSGVDETTIQEYFKEIKDGIVKYLSNLLPDEAVRSIVKS